MPQKKIILIISDIYPWHVDNGQSLKLRNLITALLPEVDVWLYALDNSCGDVNVLTPPPSGVIVQRFFTSRRKRHFYGWLALACGLPYYCGETIAWSSELKKLIAAHAGSSHAVHLDGIKLCPLLGHYGPSAKVTLSPTDAIVRSYLRMAEFAPSTLRKYWYLLTAVLTKRLERRVFGRAHKVHLVSDPDRAFIHAYLPKVPVSVIPIAINSVIEHQFAREIFKRGESYADPPSSNRTSLFVSGSWNMPGVRAGIVDFVNNVWSQVQALAPDSRLKVLFRDADLDYLEKVIAAKGVDWCTFVDDYVEEVIKHDIHVFPDKGGTGIKNRVLYALRSGRPVVGTHEVFEGIPVVDGESARICRSSGEMTAAIVELIENRQLASLIGKAGAQVSSSQFSFSSVAQQWRTFFGL